MNLKAVIVEFIGTFALCLVGAGAIMANEYMGDKGPGLTGIALAHGLTLSIVITAAMGISGGHINPAVTIAMFVCGRMSVVNAAGYVIAQLAGGLLAGLLLINVIFAHVETEMGDVVSQTMNGTPRFEPRMLANSDALPGWGRADGSSAATTRRPSSESEAGDSQASDAPAAASEPATTRPVQQIPQRNRFVENLEKVKWEGALKACIIEAVITFLLLFAIFGTAVDPRHPNIGGFGVGLTVAANILMAGPLTGGAMNPARVFGTGIVTQDPIFFEQQWVYWVGPIVGAVVAALLYQFAILPQAEKKA